MTNNVQIEIQEAREAGFRALRSLKKAKENLDSARGWGVFDMLGGGLLTTLVKHSRLESAQDCLEQARWDLEDFRREAAEVDLPGVELGDLLTFADFFFDGFLADFLVQQRINEARRRLERTIRQVEEVLRRLP